MPEKWASLMKARKEKNKQKNVRKFIQNKVLPHFGKNF